MYYIVVIFDQFSLKLFLFVFLFFQLVNYYCYSLFDYNALKGEWFLKCEETSRW